jgi:radical SAM superfamily enzyme YgiQ (UPF0313 family)
VAEYPSIFRHVGFFAMRGIDNHQEKFMRLYLINPSNPLVNIAKISKSRWNRYRVWKPLGLLTVAGLTPPDWDITVLDENLGVPDYATLPCPDLVGITAFTSQANRAYELAGGFRRRGVPVVMGGIHATMCQEEVARHVDAVVTGEAEHVWRQVLDDASRSALKRAYAGRHGDMTDIPPARHDLLGSGYVFGSIQTTRGCPLNCSFCSVSAFNGSRYRHRPVEDVVREFKSIREKLVLVVDDNLIGTSSEHVRRAKDLFRAMIRANLRKRWIGQATINMADDEELLALAAEAGCRGVFVGFESPTAEGLAEVGKKYNSHGNRDFPASVRRIQRHGILVAGSFIMGLDSDQPGIGKRIADTAERYGVDTLNAIFLTPLPGTRLWTKLEAEHRIAAHAFPEDWRYYTLTFPVARYKHFSSAEILKEMDVCNRIFYSPLRILRRVVRNFWKGCVPLVTLVANLSYRKNSRLERRALCEFMHSQGETMPVMGRSFGKLPSLKWGFQAFHWFRSWLTSFPWGYGTRLGRP